MGDNAGKITGGCLCGAVRYEAIGEPLEVGHCHCYSCRHHTGVPVVSWVMFEADKVRFTGRERSIYNSSPGVDRAFCGQCGTTLTRERRSRAWDRRITTASVEDYLVWSTNSTLRSGNQGLQ